MKSETKWNEKRVAMESSGNREKFFLKKNFWEAFSKRQEVIM